MEKFLRQCIYEHEGAKAGLQGAVREDCPYDKDTQSTEWNFWVYGCEIAAGELATLRGGVVHLMQLNKEAQLRKPREYIVEREWDETTEEAYRNGNWRPKHVRVPKHWGPMPPAEWERVA